MVGGSVHREWKDVTGWAQRTSPSFSLWFPVEQDCCGTGGASLYLDICLYIHTCAVYPLGVFLAVWRAGQNRKGFSPETSNTSHFPFAQSEREAAIQKLSRQMTVELSHHMIWESLPGFVLPRDSQTGQHAPTCLSSTSCQLPPCQWAPVEVVHLCLQGWTVWFPPLQFFIAAVWVRDVVFLPFSSSHQSCSAQTNIYLSCTGLPPEQSKGCLQSHAQLWFSHPVCWSACLQSALWHRILFWISFLPQVGIVIAALIKFFWKVEEFI